MENDLTWVWRYYELGRSYNNRLTPNQYNLVNTNTEFYAGNQWLNLPQTKAMSGLGKPVFNIIKRVTSLFVASLTSNSSTISYEPLSYYDGENINDPDTNAAVYATAEVRNLFKKFGMDYRIREALTDGAITGDYCAHFYWDSASLPYGGAFGPYRGEIKMELVDGINVMFGNPNTPEVQSQPYILIIGRDTVESLRNEAEYYRKHKPGKGGKTSDKMEGDAIQPDAENQWQTGVGGKTEITDDDGNGKCLYCYLYTKKTREETVKDPVTGLPVQEPERDRNGNTIPLKDKEGRPLYEADGTPMVKTRDLKQQVTTVCVTKATRSCVIYEDINTGLTLYPVAWGNWEKQKNQYHGRALVTGIVPNQIYINTMFALVMRHLQLMGFPKTVFNADYIREWTNEVGQAVGVRGLQPGMHLGDMAYNLQPADMSNQIMMVIDKAVAYTKDCLGATDAQLGNVKPDNTSALMVLQSSAEVPLENIRSGLYEWLESIGDIMLDMMGTYYGNRPIVRERSFTEPVTDPATGAPVIDPNTGMMQTSQVKRKVMEEFDFSQFKHLWLNVGADVGATTYYSEIAMIQTLDNLRKDGVMEVVDYLERVPDKLVPRKQELVQKLKGELAGQQQNAPAAAPPVPGGMNPAEAVKAMTGKATKGAAKARPAMGGPLDEDKAISSLPGGKQAQYEKLPTEAKKALIQQGSMKA